MPLKIDYDTAPLHEAVTIYLT